jgi:hypothetical protein
MVEQDLRDHVLLSPAVSTLRVSELVPLDVGDVRNGKGVKSVVELRPEHTKGGKGGKIVLPEKVRRRVAAFLAWKERRDERTDDGAPPCSRAGVAAVVGNVLDAARVVICGRVHERAHGVGHETLGGRNEEVGQVSPAGVEPARVARRGNDERHPVVELGHRSLRLSRDDGAGLDDLAVGCDGAVPDSGEGERLAVLAANEERLLHLVALLPFEKPTHDHEATALPKRLSVRGSSRNGLDPDVNSLHAVSMCARKDEAPSQELEATRLSNDGDRLRRCDVEPRREFGHFVESEDLAELVARC